MKRLLSLGLAALLALNLAGCTASPSEPQTPATPEAALPTAAPEATQETALPTVEEKLYTVSLEQGFNAYFNTGQTLYELIPCSGYCLLAKTEYATATRGILCDVAGCTHDSISCPAWLPGQLWYYQLFMAGDEIYIYKYRTEWETQTWEDYYQANVQPYLEEQARRQDGLTQEEFETAHRNLFAQRSQPASLFVVDPAGAARRCIPLSENLAGDVELRWCDGTALYGYTGNKNTGDPSRGYRVELATGAVTTFAMLPGETAFAAWGKQLLTRKLVTSIPIPDRDTDGEEAYQAALQSGTVEVYGLDPATGVRHKILEVPGKAFAEGGDFRGLAGNKLYFQEAELQPDGAVRYTALRAFDLTTAQWQDVLRLLPQTSQWLVEPTVVGLPGIEEQKGRYLWLNGTANAVQQLAVLDCQTGTLYTPALGLTQMALQLEQNCLSQTDDGQFLLCVGRQSGKKYELYDYALIDAEAFLQGSTDYTPVTGPEL